ncbi:MAG TPA: hypothetical protein VMS16_10415 [Mycobacterium sp.]|nr:hypothetical protein [Mycobacterium sp.]
MTRTPPRWDDSPWEAVRESVLTGLGGWWGGSSEAALGPAGAVR